MMHRIVLIKLSQQVLGVSGFIEIRYSCRSIKLNNDEKTMLEVCQSASWTGCQSSGRSAWLRPRSWLSSACCLRRSPRQVRLQNCRQVFFYFEIKYSHFFISALL